MKTPFFALSLLLASLSSAYAADCVATCQYIDVENDGTIYNKVVSLRASDEDATRARVEITRQCREGYQGRLVSTIECR